MSVAGQGVRWLRDNIHLLNETKEIGKCIYTLHSSIDYLQHIYTSCVYVCKHVEF